MIDQLKQYTTIQRTSRITLALSIFSFVLFQQNVNAKTDDYNVASKSSGCKQQWAGVTSFPAVVERVVDGDTIRVNANNKSIPIRMLSIDTPETHYLGKSQGYWGVTAAKHLENLLAVGSAVEIEFDEEKCDQYGRVLGYVHQGGMNVNEEMVKSGLAVMYCIYPNIKYCQEFGRINDTNIRNKKGIFSDSSVEIPYEWRRKMSKRSLEKYVGTLSTSTVYAPQYLNQIPVGDRIFFMSKSAIQPPFKLSTQSP